MFENNSANFSPEIKYIFAFAILSACPGLIFILNCHKHCSEIIQFINGIFQFCEKYQSKSQYSLPLVDLSVVSKLNLCTAYSLTLVLMVVPIAFIFGLHMIRPCLPSLVGYQLIPNCTAVENFNFDSLLQIILKLAILTLNYVIWMIGNSATAFSVSILLIIGPLSTISFIHS